jgi:hypothetical protein
VGFIAANLLDIRLHGFEFFHFPAQTGGRIVKR